MKNHCPHCGASTPEAKFAEVDTDTAAYCLGLLAYESCQLRTRGNVSTALVLERISRKIQDYYIMECENESN